MRSHPSILFLFLSVAGCGAVPEARAPQRVPQASQPSVAQARPEIRQCHAALGEAGARFSALPDRYYGAGCSALGAVQLSSLAGDRGGFGLNNIGPVACPLAESLAGWARYGVDRAARQYLGSPLSRIETMGSYSCRTIAGSTKMSAHARAEAVDVAAFVLADGRRISVLDDWNGSSDARAFLSAIHDSACKRFGTVLGPNYNAAHKNHFHLEAGGRSFCR